MRARRWVGLVLTLAAFCWPLQVFAEGQDYPTRPITLVVSQAAGGGNDLVARILADRLSQRLGKTVLVENRVGAGGVVAVTSVAHAAPDGYTLLLLGNSDVVNQYLHSNIQYNVQRDFAPISLITTSPLVLMRNSAFKGTTLPEVVALAKASPGKIAVGNPGVGTVHHISVEMLNHAAGIELVHVPYQGTMPSMNDFLANQIPMIIANLIAVLPMMQSGSIHPVAVAGKVRSPLLPDVPTYGESDVTMNDIVSRSGVAVPKGTPPAIIDKLSTEIRAVAADPAFRKKIVELGSIVGGGSTQDYARQIEEDVRDFGTLIPAMNIKID